ncbi:hypothetical protein TNCV_4828141 [Trichonephila clavipes]|uniref:Transposase n=1 Tax=Trichonephila clavipes TaxID=2585209 RepID=A0A8X6SM09_TRICX|nr:hypothetical protein TNCV_4828141 [Trichonephila clavipes]
MQVSKKEQQGVFQSLAAEGVRGREMHRGMKAVYGEYTVCVIQVLWNGTKDSLKANAVKTTLQQFRWKTLEHPQYSPGLSPCDFHAFHCLNELFVDINSQWMTK